MLSLSSRRGMILYVLILLTGTRLALAASLTISPSVGPPTTKVTLSGSGFAANESVNLALDSSPAGSVVATSSGAFTLPFQVPKSTPPGVHSLSATGATSGLTATATFTVHTNWTSFKDEPSRVGVNPFENTISPANAKFLTLAWQGIMGDEVDFSSPAVVNGVVYIGSFDGKLYAFNEDGCAPAIFCQPLWSGTTGNDITSSPAVANGVVYIGSADHKLYAFPAKGCGQSSCAPLWTGTSGGAILESAPLVVNGVVYVGSFDRRFYAFSAAGCGASSCLPLWIASTGGGITSSPAFANGVVYIGSSDGKLYAFDASGCGQRSCSPLWTGQAGSSIMDAGPAIAAGVVYIGSFDGGLYAFNAAG